ncbi:hypothetical protein ACH41E_30950 [Streptomyces sp. NPDC020412]|uniref:hypothetical protein n=1 Tax=Streptomyces sp. NPDC020412 TaxID=3365073 RepID=UPI0037B9E9DB
MSPYLVLPFVALAIFFAASGIAGIARGWVLPRNRRHVRNPRLYGWGQLALACALCWQSAFGLLVDDSDVRLFGTLTGALLLVAALMVMLLGQFRRPRA